MNGEHDASDGRDINILLLGPTGVGKSTFINSFANYLCYQSIEEARTHDLRVLIPSRFEVTDIENFEQHTIEVGQYDVNENLSREGQSATELCRSYVLPTKKSRIRLIDTPGIGDTRGIEQDDLNMREILAYLTHYEYLNAICIFLKPNEARMSIQFRFCITELLRHLHTGARDNLHFIITNGRSTFYRPGSSKVLLQVMLKEYRDQHNVDVPFNAQNTFVLDNECFRYLAMCQRNCPVDEDMADSYANSWTHSTKECIRLLSHISKCPIYQVSQMLTLNEAEQIIRILPRPLAETQRLIEENIQRAQECKKRATKNPSAMEEGMLQVEAHTHVLNHPRTVCTSAKCSQSSDVAAGSKKNYSTICHDQCYSKGVVQETLHDAKLQDCEAFDYRSGDCTVCGCSWKKHIHITYEYVRKESSSNESKVTLEDIDRRITNLRDEATKILEIYQQLRDFYQVNALFPAHDQLTEYLELMINEEEHKCAAGENNRDVIENLKQTKSDIEKATVSMKAAQSASSSSDTSRRKTITLGHAFNLVADLYNLPINGQSIREQVEKIKTVEKNILNQREKCVDVRREDNQSELMQAF